MSTSEGYHECVRMFSTSEGYHEYIGGCSAHRRDTMIHVGGYHDACRGYHEYTPRCTHDSPDVLNIPRCTHDISDLLIESRRCTGHPRYTEHPPMY